MAGEVSHPKVVLEVDHRQALLAFIETGKASKDLGAAIEALGKQFSAHSESSKKSEQSIKRLMDAVTGGGATAKFNDLVTVVERLGGTSKLTATQTENLAKQIDRLKAQGGEVPAVLDKWRNSMSGSLAGSQALGAASKDLQGQLQGLAGQAGPVGSALAALGPTGLAAAAGLAAAVAAAGALGKLASEAATWGDKIKDTATATGMSVESVQRLEYAAKVAEVPLEQVTSAVLKMQKAMVDSPEKVRALGLSLDNLRGMAPEQQLVAVGKALQDIHDPAERNAAAMDLFGKSWADIAPLILDGLDAMKDANVQSAETIDKLDALKQQSNTLSAAWDDLWQSIGASVGQSGIVSDAVDGITSALKRLAGATKERGFIAAWGDEINRSPARDKLMAEFDEQTQNVLFRNNQAAINRRNAAARAAGPERYAPISETLTAVVPKTDEELEAEKKHNKEMEAERKRHHAEMLAEEKRYTAAVDAYNKAVHGTAVGPFPEEAGRELPDQLKIRSLAIGGFSKGALDADTARTVARVQGENAANLEKGLKVITDTKTETKNWAQELQNVANMADFMPGIFGEVLGSVAGIGTAVQGLQKSMKGGLTGGAGLFSGAGLGNLLSNFSGGLQVAGLALNLGKAVFGAFHQSESEKIAKDVGRDFGVQISEELAKTIEKEGKGRFDGALMHLGEIIGEAGGVAAFGAGRAAGALRDVFSAVDRGTMDIAEAGKVFDDVFGDVAAASISKTTGIASAQLRELVLLAKDFGLESEALKAFMRGEATGLAGNLAGGLGSMKTAREKGGVGGLAGQGAATALSGAVAADFAAMREAGMSLGEALQAIAPSVTAMREELTAAGLQGTAAFASLEAQIAITTGEVTGPLVTGIGSFVGALVNMHNMNLLTAADFGAITEQIGVNVAALEEQGVTGVQAAQALQPDLQKIWELQQATGFAVDATTQSLIDQAVQAGLVGEEHRSAADKMAEASERTAKAVEFLAARFGYLAEEVNKVPDNKTITVNTAYTSSGTPPDPTGGYAVPMHAMEGFSVGTGGFRDFGIETPAFLHGVEAVVTPDDFSRITSTSMLAGAQMLAQAAALPAASTGLSSASMGPLAVPGGGGSSSNAAVVININGVSKDPKQIADEVAYVLTRGNSPALLDEIRKRTAP